MAFYMLSSRMSCLSQTDRQSTLNRMADHEQIELLHTYHLDLWSQIEAQLRVLRAAQDEIAKPRSAG
jgi:hypothetical protein